MLRINAEYSSDLSQELEELFKALANVNRIVLLYSLSSGEIENISVNEISQIMKLSQPAASQHLKILKSAKILDAKKQGNHIYYNFNQKSLIKHKKKIDFLFTCVLAKCQELENRE